MSSDTTSASSATGRPPPHWFLRIFSALHVALYRLSGGRLFGRLAGDPICLVTMTGAKSGRRRTLPLMYIPHGEGIILVASQGGAPSHPLWYHNLVAHPDIEVEHGGERRKLRARLVDSEEKAALWPVCVEAYAPFVEYRKRTTRDIPMFLCEP